MTASVSNVDWAVIAANRVVKGSKFAFGHVHSTRDKIAEALRRERTNSVKGTLCRLLEANLLSVHSLEDVLTTLNELAELEERKHG